MAVLYHMPSIFHALIEHAPGDGAILNPNDTSPPSAGIIPLLCLGASIALHLVSVLLIAYVWTSPSGSEKVSYLEMRDLVPVPVDSPPPVLSAQVKIQEPVLAPLPPAVPRQADQPVPADQPEPAKAAPEPTVSEDIRTTPLGLGMAYGFVSSLGDGATLREDIRDYYLVLVEKINRIWWERAAELSSAINQDGIVFIAIQRDGTLLGRIIRQGTGSPEVDQALLESIDKAAPLPPLPDSYSQQVFSAPLKITAPSRLLGITNSR